MTETDAREVTAHYAYDALNRLTETSFADSSQNTRYFHDVVQPDCGTGETFAIGRLTRMTDQSGETRWCFDRRGNMTRKVQVTGEFLFTTRWTYTVADRIASLIYPSGSMVTYGRDALGRVDTVNLGTIGLIDAIDYLPFGPLSKITFADGSALHKQYNADYRIDLIDSSQTDGLRLDYTLDAIGNVVGIGRAIGAPAEETYGYDALSRLTTVTRSDGSNVLELVYDATGNRTSKRVGTATAQTYTYAPGSHRLQAVAGVTRTYDAAGNTTHRGRTGAWVYDGRRRLVQVQGTALATYAYNGRGERVRKERIASLASGPQAPVGFAYGENGQLLHEAMGATTDPCECVPAPDTECLDMMPPECDNPPIDASAKDLVLEPVPVDPAPPTVDYIYVDDLLVAVKSSAQGLHTVHTDHLGTPRKAFPFGTAQASWSWPFVGNPFGEIGATQSGLQLNKRFPGQYLDPETGLHYNYFRDYDPATGRYIESDPIGLWGGISTFSYVFNGPINWTDPSGLKVRMCCRPADLPYPLSETNHCWIQTDTYESGMGPARGGVPAQNSEFDLPGDPTTTNDHTGQSGASNSTCEDVPDVDEECVDDFIKPGRSLGGFGPTNNCQTFAASVLNACTLRDSPRQDSLQSCLAQCARSSIPFNLCHLLCR